MVMANEQTGARARPADAPQSDGAPRRRPLHQRLGVRGGLAVLVVAGLWLWQLGLILRLRADVAQADAHAVQLERSLEVLQLESRLAAAYLEANVGNPESARLLASDFFTRLQEHVEGLAPEEAEPFRAVLRHRDDVITFLSRREPFAGQVLGELLFRFQAARSGRPVPPWTFSPDSSRTPTGGG
ncbi:MAG: hypothetical protein D6701_05390 [Gemmatimonadetes bacterium]|nr:MAG: hypothetical protein D6701_05390 [Gemmatimonadota bacterium]